MLRRHIVPSLLLATLISVLALPIALLGQSFCTGTLGALGWQCTTVDSSADVGSVSRLVYSTDGSPMIAYTHIVKTRGLSLVTALKFATRAASGSWSATTLDPGVGHPSAIRLNPVSKQPAISYGCLKLAERTPTGWSTQSAAAVKECGGTTFAFDQSGTPYAAYSDTMTKRVSVGSRSGTSWSFQTLNVQAYYMSLDVGPDGLPAVAVEDMVSRGLVYASKTTAGTWQYVTLDPVAPGTNTFVSHVALRFDPSGAPTIAYRNGPFVRFARREPGSGVWTVETVYSSLHLTAVSLDHANGEPIIAFLNDETHELLVAKRDSGLGLWRTSTVAQSAILIATGIAYDATHDLVGISYGPRDVSDLLFAEGPRLAIGQ